MAEDDADAPSAADDGNASAHGCMAGIDGAEILQEAVGPCNNIDQLRMRELEATLSKLGGCGVLASSTVPGRGPASDYDPDFFVLLHPTSFPYGAGGKPDNMSLETYARTLLRRTPNKQFACNIGLTFDLHDAITRHNNNKLSKLRASGSPAMFEELSRIAPEDVDRLFQAIGRSEA